MLPDWRYNGNPYLEHLSESLSSAGIKVIFDNFPDGFFKLTKIFHKYPEVCTIHIHWTMPFMGHIYWAGSRSKKNAKLILFAMDLALCRLRRKRIIWTVHNLLEHESPDPATEVIARRILFRFSNKVILHSAGAKKVVQDFLRIHCSDNVSIIPHGNYKNMYPISEAAKRNLQKRFNLIKSNTVLLFFGAIRYYKGLDLLVPTFKRVLDPNIRLIIAGHSSNPEVADWLNKEAESDPRILLSLEFISDEEVGAYFSVSDAVVVTFQRTLTSGSVILAMEFGKPLVLPEEARVLDVPGDQGALYYKDLNQLTEILETISKRNLARMGEHNANAAKALDWNRIATETAFLYDV